MVRGVLLSALLLVSTSQMALSATRALVIGIDAYPHEVSLEGAVKDAQDVAAALQGAGVTQLLTSYDAQARKDDIRAAWVDLVAGSAEGDTIILTYAGHGSQMPELVAGDEEDGLDEFLQLPGFDRARAEETKREIIVDNELNAWFSEAEAKGVRVLFVSDSCHSGGMSRSFSGKTRLAPAVTVKLSPPSQEAESGAKIREADFREVTVLAASLESQPSPEVIIEGEPRGALSWSFARAVEGAADRDGDGRISRIELEDYVFANVKHQSEALQVPNFTPQLPRSVDEVMLPIGEAGAGMAWGQAGKTAAELGWQDKLALDAGGADLSLQHVGGAGVPYRWDVDSGVFYTPNGDVAGEHVDDKTVQGVVDKFVLLDFLKILASRNPGSVSLSPVKDIYAKGDRIAFEAPASHYRNMIVFNLANTGEVQLLDVQQEGTESHVFKLTDLEVVEPFGADHLVVISTNEPIDAIAALLARKNVDAASLLQLLLSRLDGKETAVAIQPLYTREKL
ncbi:putative caspase-like protein [Pararhizobium capsulatum DSM 1112]|uniref:Caspase-like protein n=1 Tax=Pararhizobium capsulatum DSM 1112 TaxID=1121113 RepID=A0ABU0BQX7_9HYPH|nr:caspase family protein [Pararhizobium capsulatum]MDQ0320139.1 putative caspase-like protein [Pararhizobium capsulatum DSM 1112]